MDPNVVGVIYAVALVSAMFTATRATVKLWRRGSVVSPYLVAVELLWFPAMIIMMGPYVVIALAYLKASTVVIHVVEILLLVLLALYAVLLILSIPRIIRIVGVTVKIE